MVEFTNEEVVVLRELVSKLGFSFYHHLFVAEHAFYKDKKKRRRFLKKLGVKE